MARAFSQVIAKPDDEAAPDDSQIAIDGKTLRGSKDAEGKAEHVLSAFCAWLEQPVGHTSSRIKEKEIPDTLELIQFRDLADKIITGDAIFCQREIVAKIAEKSADYLVPVKENQRDLRKEITTAFNEPVFPLNEWLAPPEADRGRIEQRQIAASGGSQRVHT